MGKLNLVKACIVTIINPEALYLVEHEFTD